MDEVSLHQSVPPPPNKKEKGKKGIYKKKTIENKKNKYRKKLNTNQHTNIFLNNKRTKKNTTLPLQKVQIIRSLSI